MRHSGLHSPAQEIAAEAFSDDAPELPAGSGGPVYVRSRANPLALVKPGQVPAAPPPPEPPQVRFWRTPDRLIGSVWARGGAEALLPEDEADAMAEQPVVALPDDVVIDAALAEDEGRAPTTPFDLLSDHAFWEVVAAEMAEEEAGGQAAAAPQAETAIASPPPRPVEPMVAKPSARNTVPADRAAAGGVRPGRCDTSRRARRDGASRDSPACSTGAGPDRRGSLGRAGARRRRDAPGAGRDGGAGARRRPVAARWLRRCRSVRRSASRRRRPSSCPISPFSASRRRSRPRSRPRSCSRMPASSKACWKTSTSGARSSGLPRPGGDAVRAGAGSGHEVLAGDFAGGRHRPLDERDFGACGGDSRQERDRHRTAQRQARDGLSARASGEPGFRELQAQARLGLARPSAASR